MKRHIPIDFKLIQAITGNVYRPDDDYLVLLKENNLLKEELRIWIQCYYEIIEIFGKIIPVNYETAHNSIDKQNTLLVLCRDVIKSIDDPEILMQNKQNQNKPTNNKNINPKEDENNNPPNFSQKKDFYIEQSESSKLTNRLHEIDTMLSKEIAKNKRYIPKYISNNQTKSKKKSSHKKGKSPFPPNTNPIPNTLHDKNTKNVIQNNYDFKKQKNVNIAQIERKKPRTRSSPADHKLVVKKKRIIR